ncbi:MAG: cytochrome c [Bacteroidota bacterium]
MKIIKTTFKWVGIILLLFISVIAITVFARKNHKFEAPYPEIKASNDSAVIARGKDFVYGPAHCAYCHTTLDKLPQVEKGEFLPLTGGHLFPLPIANLYTPNLTPDPETGIGKLTDGEIARALRHGVGHDGRALMPLMPFNNLSDEDLTAVISYLRSTAPIKNEVPKSEYNTLGTILKALVIKPVGPEGAIPKSVPHGPTVEYGQYLVEHVANCRGCHTARDLKTGDYTGPFYGGGFKLVSEMDPTVMLCTPNISPDPKFGVIANWSLEQFIQRFRKGRVIQASIMPWGPFSHMSDEDLTAIYSYLKTVKPVPQDPGPRISKAS